MFIMNSDPTSLAEQAREMRPRSRKSFDFTLIETSAIGPTTDHTRFSDSRFPFNPISFDWFSVADLLGFVGGITSTLVVQSFLRGVCLYISVCPRTRSFPSGLWHSSI